MRWSALSQKMNCFYVRVLSTANKYLREYHERAPLPFSRNYESLNFFSQYYIVLEVVHLLLLFYTLALSLIHSLHLSRSRSCCILLLFTIISLGRILLYYFWAVLLFLLLTSFFFIVNTSTHTHSPFTLSFTHSLKYFPYCRALEISFCHLSVVNIIPKVTSWKPISLTLNCSS